MTYKYTHEYSNLTSKQRNFYEQHGYIVIKNNVSPILLDKMCQRFVDICNDNAVGSVLTKMKDPSLINKGVKGEYLINKVQDFLYDDVFWEYCINKPMVDIVEGIIGPQITAVHSMFINKPPDADASSSLHPLHQDLHYFPFRPEHKIVASWTAMERVDEKNGCLYVVPGSHTRELYKHEYPQGMKKAMYHGVQGLDQLPKVHVVMEKGDTVFFHPILLHGSGPNTTKGFRKAISCHYAASDCHFIDIRGTTQENIAHEVEQMALKRGYDLKIMDVWKAKSRLVRGTPDNFQRFSSQL